MKNLPLTNSAGLRPWLVKSDSSSVIEGDKAWLYVSNKACWICGHPFSITLQVVVAGAISVVTRIYRGSLSHKEWAEYATKACPFIFYPDAMRREAGLGYDGKTR